jgi:hypothetical protein
MPERRVTGATGMPTRDKAGEPGQYRKR